MPGSVSRPAAVCSESAQAGLSRCWVIFQLTADTVGISARSTGEINVQVIMESFGGGGHQNVAGAQVQDKSLEEVCQQAVALSKKYIEENDSDESNLTTGY